MDTGFLLVYISPLLLNAALGIFLIHVVYQHRHRPSARPLIFLILSGALWSVGYALELISPTLEARLLFARLQYFGITTVPLAWFIYTFQYTGAPSWSERSLKQRISLLAVPLATLALVWTNEVHGWIWRSVQLESAGGFQILVVNHGPAFWIYLIYGYALVLTGSVKLLIGLLNSFRIYRWQAILALIACLFPWFGNLVYVLDWSPIPHLDWTPFSFTIAGLFFTISLFRFHLVDILPIAHRTVFAGLPDCMAVLDSENVIVDINEPAKAMFGAPGQALQGKVLDQVIPELADWVAKAGASKDYFVEITKGEGPEQRFYELHVLPLTGPFPLPVGRLVICHQITQHKREQAQLEQAVAERTAELTQALDQLKTLTSRIQEVEEIERRRIASELHDRVGQNLTALHLNIQLVLNSVNANGQTKTIGRLCDSLDLVEETTRQVRDVMADLHPPVLDEFGLASALHWYGDVFSQRTGIITRVIGEEFSPRLPARREIVLFRLAQEALHNVAKHAEANQVKIFIESAGEFSSLIVEDDGLGFTPASPNGSPAGAHWGLLTMQQRAASIGAELFIDSAPGHGTLVMIRFAR